jgi:pyrroline-5-carboxylate reductase
VVKVGIIGYGNMGSAFSAQLAKRKGFRVYVYDIDSKKINRKAYGGRNVFFCRSLDFIEKVRVLFLCIKPQDMDKALDKLSPLLKERKNIIVVSIAAGVTLSYLKGRLAGKLSLFRAMPNMGLKAGESFTGLSYAKGVSSSAINLVKKIFLYVGSVVILNESMMDAVTAVSGSGPGYIYYFLYALQEAACKLGFSKEDSRQMVMQTLKGCCKVLEQDKRGFYELVNAVSSKKGTTEAGLRMIDKHGFRKAVEKCVAEAYRRAKELSKCA